MDQKICNICRTPKDINTLYRNICIECCKKYKISDDSPTSDIDREIVLRRITENRLSNIPKTNDNI